jgi:hypothetical protein
MRLPTYRLSVRRLPDAPTKICHPEQSEGSAFLTRYAISSAHLHVLGHTFGVRRLDAAFTAKAPHQRIAQHLAHSTRICSAGQSPAAFMFAGPLEAVYCAILLEENRVYVLSSLEI